MEVGYEKREVGGGGAQAVNMQHARTIPETVLAAYLKRSGLLMDCSSELHHFPGQSLTGMASFG